MECDGIANGMLTGRHGTMGDRILPLRWGDGFSGEACGCCYGISEFGLLLLHFKTCYPGAPVIVNVNTEVYETLWKEVMSSFFL